MSDVISPMATNVMTRRDVGDQQPVDRGPPAARNLEQQEQATEGQVVASSDDVQSAVASLQQVIETTSQRRLQFDVHEDTESLFVQVSDRATGEVIRTIPSQEVLELHGRISDAVGALFNSEA
jgi:flagellar protein FlaG